MDDIIIRECLQNKKIIRKFASYFYFVNWYSISFGIHFDIKNIYIELHIPFGFIHIGMEKVSVINMEINSHYKDNNNRIFGYKPAAYLAYYDESSRKYYMKDLKN